jgi:hypothetical protein
MWMNPVWAKLLPVTLSLASGPTTLKLQPPALISLTSTPAPAATSKKLSLWPAPAPGGGGRSGSGLRLTDNFRVSAGKILESTGVSWLYTVRPGLDLGVTSAVATFNLPTGRLRAVEAFAILRFRF